MRIIQQLKRHEGFRGKPYKDTTGNTTIGYGRNLDDNSLTKKEAEVLLQNDVLRTEEKLWNTIPDIMVKLNNARQGVLINMAFNMGVEGLMTFEKMLSHLRNGQYPSACQEMFDSLWSKQVGSRALELARQMRSGKYQQP